MKLAVSPVLVITDQLIPAMKACSDRGFSMITGDSDSIYERLFCLKRAQLDNPVAVGDINPEVAGRDIEQKLLKVLEDLTIDVMFFSSKDVFSEVIISRFMRVQKAVAVLPNEYNSKESFLHLLKEEENPHMALRGVLQQAPSFLPFFLEFRQSRIPAKRKILELL